MRSSPGLEGLGMFGDSLVQQERVGANVDAPLARVDWFFLDSWMEEGVFHTFTVPLTSCTTLVLYQSRHDQVAETTMMPRALRSSSRESGSMRVSSSPSSLVARLDGDSAPRTHFPVMTITLSSIQMVEKISEESDKAKIIAKARVKDLGTEGALRRWQGGRSMNSAVRHELHIIRRPTSS